MWINRSDLWVRCVMHVEPVLEYVTRDRRTSIVDATAAIVVRVLYMKVGASDDRCCTT